MAGEGNQLPITNADGSPVDASAAGVPNGQGTPAGGKVDDGNRGFDPKQFVPIKDLNALRSTLDKQNAELRRQFETAQKELADLKKSAEDAKLKGMTADERAAYEIEREQYEMEQERQRAAQAVQSADYMRNLFDLKMYYAQMGAPQEVVQISDPAEMQDKFLKWYANKVDTLSKELESLKAKAAEPPAAQPPKVSTHKPGSGTTAKIKWSTIAIGSPEETKLYEDLKFGRITQDDIDFTA